MRRILITILCVFLLTTAVSAAGSVSNLQNNTTIATDGTCQVSLGMQLNVDSGGDLQFPLPGNAKDITLNGERAKTNWSNSQRWVDLSTVVYGPGNYTLSLHYYCQTL